MPTIKSQGGPTIELKAACLDCRVKHHIQTTPGTNFLREMDEWECKHRGHRIEFTSPRRSIPRDMGVIGEDPWWLAGFRDNANIKVAFASSVAMTFTSVNSLASDTNLLAGASALAVDNTSNLYLDFLLAGFFKNNTGAAPTASREINVWLYRAYDDTPTYPDTLLGTDATKTITTANILNSLGRPAASMLVAATTSQTNAFDAGSVAAFFGGVCPSIWSVFVVHNSGQALHSSGNTVSYKPVYATTS